MNNKKYYTITIFLFVAISLIASGLSSNAFAAEDDMVLATKTKAKLSTSIKVEQNILLYDATSTEKYDMYTGLFLRVIINAPKNFGIMIGADPQISHQKTDPNKDQVSLSTPPFVNVSYSTGLKAGPLAWNNVYFRMSSTTPELYKNNSVYTFFSTGTMISFVPADFMEIYYNISITKFVNEYENGPEGSNSSFKVTNGFTVQFNILQGLKYCKSLAVSMTLGFDNTLKYENTWVGSHNTTLSLGYSVIQEFMIYAYFYSNGNNYTPDGDSNFSLYHRNTSTFGVGVGSTF